MQEQFINEINQALDGIEISEREHGFICWVAGQDKWTVDNLLSLINKCRKEDE